MPVRLVVTADNHLNRYHAKMPVWRLEERRRWLRRAFRRAVDGAIELKADFFLQCGDLFDNVDPRNAERSFVATCLADLRQAGVVALAVGGNHDSPRQRTDHGGFLAADLYARLGGLRLFSEPDRIEFEEFERGGMRIAIGGAGWDALSSFGQDPLAGKPFLDGPEGRADWKVLLTHSNLEGHTFPGAFEPCISRDTIAHLDADILLAGHVHARNHFEIGGTHVIVPGATEKMHFEEFSHDPGYLVIELDDAKRFTHRWVSHNAQPRCRITVTGHELTPEPYGLRRADQDPNDLLVERIEAQRDQDCITTLFLEGRLPREVYGALDLAKVQEAGTAANFFFEIDTTLLELESEQGETSHRGIRLSQVEELQETAAAMRDSAVSDEERRLVLLGLDRVMDFYH
jgi:DNA repair protein SbcD/Mre11